MRENNHSPLGFYMLGIAALFLAGFLLLVILGARTYRNTTAAQDTNYQTRALLAYISSVTRAGDMSGEVSVRTDGPQEQDVLVVGDGSGYASRIYRYEGYLVEDYAEADAPYDPKDAMKIGKTEIFLAEWSGHENLLHVTTQAGSVFVHLRSGAGSAAGSSASYGSGDTDRTAGNAAAGEGGEGG